MSATCSEMIEQKKKITEEGKERREGGGRNEKQMLQNVKKLVNQSVTSCYIER